MICPIYHSGEWNSKKAVASLILGATSIAALALSILIFVHQHNLVGSIGRLSRVPGIYNDALMASGGAMLVGTVGYVLYKFKKVEKFYSELPKEEINKAIEEMMATGHVVKDISSYGIVLCSGKYHVYGLKAYKEILNNL